jgi:glycosyltransferase involved in cell wall biosynthesis
MPENFAFAVAGGYDLPRGKGQREFLRAAADIHARIPHARFLLIGRGNMSGLLRADIERLGLQDKARLTPYCTDMPRAMNAIDCLVHPQIGTEALGLVVCEAFACGKPVIASAIDGVKEAFAIGGLGRLVKPEDTTELAEAMVAQLAQPLPGDTQRLDLHAKVEREFSIPAWAERMGQMYARLSRPDSLVRR